MATSTDITKDHQAGVAISYSINSTDSASALESTNMHHLFVQTCFSVILDTHSELYGVVAWKSSRTLGQRKPVLLWVQEEDPRGTLP